MEKVKIFYKCISSYHNSIELEDKINTWLNNTNIEITRVLQDASGRLDHHLTITIFYKELS